MSWKRNSWEKANQARSNHSSAGRPFPIARRLDEAQTPGVGSLLFQAIEETLARRKSESDKIQIVSKGSANPGFFSAILSIEEMKQAFPYKIIPRPEDLLDELSARTATSSDPIKTAVIDCGIFSKRDAFSPITFGITFEVGATEILANERYTAADILQPGGAKLIRNRYPHTVLGKVIIENQDLIIPLQRNVAGLAKQLGNLTLLPARSDYLS